jgi:hypothetical protein
MFHNNLDQSVNVDKINEFEKLLSIPFEKLGTVTKEEIIINDENWGSIADWKNKYDNSIENYLNNKGE